MTRRERKRAARRCPSCARPTLEFRPVSPSAPQGLWICRDCVWNGTIEDLRAARAEGES